METPEICIELTNLSGLQGKKRSVSSPRDAMFTGNLGQILTVAGATRRRHRTMAEYRYAEATFKIAFPTDSEIIKTIPRFPRSGGASSIDYNPRTIVIYQDYHTHVVDILDVVEYHTLHQHYGFDYKRNDEVWDKLTPGAEIPKGTVLSDSPLVTSDGDYMFGLQVPTILNSDPAVAEDGFVISRWLVDQITPTGFGTRTMGFGAKQFPLNRYGNREYKIVPDIGETINQDGLLMVARQYNELLSVANLSPRSLQRRDLYDIPIYGEPGGTIVDIVVERNPAIAGTQMPTGMDEQLYKYWNADQLFYTKILDEYKILKRRRNKLQISDKFQALVVEAIARVGKDYFKTNRQEDFEELPPKVNMVWRGMPLDEWRIDITFRYNPTPNVGVKLTDTHGARSENLSFS